MKSNGNKPENSKEKPDQKPENVKSNKNSKDIFGEKLEKRHHKS